jgi:peptide methionine sulfoxide reductase MsrB
MMLLLGSSSSALLGGIAARSAVGRAGTISANFDGPVVMGTEEMMADKGTGHGTSTMPCQKNLRWSCDVETADRICNHNRHYAEHGGYWESTTFLSEESEASGEITFYDSNTGKPLFFGPKGRDWNSFVKESKAHGWPSFRDSEVNWEHVRVLPNGECISADGTHLGHNLPDGTGNRYCINLVSVAGKPLD